MARIYWLASTSPTQHVQESGLVYWNYFNNEMEMQQASSLFVCIEVWPPRGRSLTEDVIERMRDSIAMQTTVYGLKRLSRIGESE